MRFTVALIIRDIDYTLFPCLRSSYIIHHRLRLQGKHIIDIGIGDSTARSSNRTDLDRITVCLGHRNPEDIDTIELATLVTHTAVVETKGIVFSCREVVQRNGIVGKNQTALVSIMRANAFIIGYIQTMTSAFAVVTLRTNVPFVGQLVVYILVSRRVKRPTVTISFILEITRVILHSLYRRHYQQRQQ